MKVFSRRMKLSDQHFNRIILITVLRIYSREGKGGNRVRRFPKIIVGDDVLLDQDVIIQRLYKVDKFRS